MSDRETPVDADTARPLQERRRAKRGVVASYIREISGRRHRADPHGRDAAARPVQSPEEGRP